jgi:hypothetical protein
VRDLLIITPSRGRPAAAARLAAACAGLCTTDWRLLFCLDDDDPAADAYPAQSDRVRYLTGARRSLSAWTNAAAGEYGGGYRALCSLGDDHVPRTPGWDALLLDAVEGMGGGFAYPDDLLQRDQLATACLVSAPIAAALGWLMLPACRHYYVDNAWMELGGAAGCLAYVPEAVVEHVHWVAGAAQRDATYDEAAAGMAADQAAFEAWRTGPITADIAAVAKARG